MRRKRGGGLLPRRGQSVLRIVVGWNGTLACRTMIGKEISGEIISNASVVIGQLGGPALDAVNALTL